MPTSPPQHDKTYQPAEYLIMLRLNFFERRILLALVLLYQATLFDYVHDQNDDQQHQGSDNR